MRLKYEEDMCNRKFKHGLVATVECFPRPGETITGKIQYLHRRKGANQAVARKVGSKCTNGW